MRFDLCSTALTFRIVVIALSVLFPMSSVTIAQTDEHSDVEIVSAEDVGRFRPSKDPNLQQVAESIVKQTNQFRQSEDLKPLSSSSALQQTARKFADYMAETNRYGHTADGRQPSQRASAQGYEFCIVAENIAYHFHTLGIATEALAEQAFTGWKESPGHRRNMLKPHVTETGVAVRQSETTGVYYAVQLFGRPKSASVSFTLQNHTKNTVKYAIGERTFELPARYSRKHRMCRPSTVKVMDRDRTVAEPTPADGATLTLVESGDGLKVE